LSEETWEGELAIDIAGLQEVGLGKIKIIRLEENEEKTVRVCPDCFQIPEKIEHQADYFCHHCNKKFKNWFALRQALPISDTKGIPLDKRLTRKTEKAIVSKLDLKKSNLLVLKREYGIIALDDKARRNLQILGTMCKEFKKVVVFKLVFSKGGKEHLFYITVNDDNSLRAREIIPINKVRQLPKELEVYIEDTKISGEDLKKLMDSIPEINPENLTLETEAEKLKKNLEKISESKELSELEKILSEKE